MTPTTAEIAVEIQRDNPLGSKNLIQIRLKATKNTTPIKIRSNKFVFIGKKPFLGLVILDIPTP
jgi:hypothetical protein